MTLSIIIISYNTKQYTDDCISSIYNSTIEVPYEIIVVDNNSSDGSVEMLQTKYPGVITIANTTNKLFAKANNQGAKIAKGDYLLLLNSDTIVYDDNLQKLVNYFQLLPSRVICIGPKILNINNSLQSCGFPNPSIMERLIMCFKLYKILPYPINRYLLPMGAPIQKAIPRKVGWVAGACMMVRRVEYLTIGGLSEKLEFYGEEPEFGYRSYKLHYQTWYYPDAEIIHLGGQSTQKETIHTEDEVRLRRYALLQKETVGYKTAIRMSQIVLLASYIKRMISPNKEYFSQAITWEKKVITYLKKKKVIYHEKAID